MKYLGAVLDVSSVKVTNLADGTTSSDAINKGQLDAVRIGTFWKDRVRVVATSNVTISSGLENGDTIDGVTLATGNRVLLSAQSTASQNGIYVVVASGTASRATDLATGSNAAGVYVAATEGTTYADTKWHCLSDDGAAVVGTDATTWEQDVASTYTADGTTLDLTGSEFGILDGGVGTTQLATNAVTTAKITDSNVTTAKIADNAVTTAKILDANVTAAKLAADSVTTAKILDANVTTAKIADSNVTTGKIADNAVTTAKINDSAVTTAKINDAAVTDAKLATKPNKTYTTAIGNGSLTEIPVTHNLGTKAVNVQVYDSSTFADVLVDIVRTSTSVVTLTFATAPSGNAYMVVVQGRSD